MTQDIIMKIVLATITALSISLWLTTLMQLRPIREKHCRAEIENSQLRKKVYQLENDLNYANNSHKLKVESYLVKPLDLNAALEINKEDLDHIVTEDWVYDVLFNDIRKQIEDSGAYDCIREFNPQSGTHTYQMQVKVVK